MQKSVLTIMGKRIAYHRKRLDLTQKELGDLVGGKSQSVISSWEKGIADPGTENILMLSKVLGVTPHDLIGYTDGTSKMVVQDDSMEPVIRPGDVLDIDTKASIHDGDTVLCDTTAKNGLLRRLFRSGAQFILLAANPAIPPIKTDKRNVDIKGKVTDIHRKL
jgi:phage repressor protein C with HTH and peptisase S24 domain